eukprot:TRINITY_DN27396_c0_g1_i1.p1 TRINITY_DN27396_c0_g1~~TRINITY_DN27396_c0_g1_i1.p1  ORF type:complete len:251 (+),score=68.25 TRINITY_DN27396_c0_g1_i1:30-755(+)
MSGRRDLPFIKCLFEVEMISPCQVKVEHLGYLYVAHYNPERVEELRRQQEAVVPTMYGAKRFLEMEMKYLESKMRTLNRLIEKYGGDSAASVEGYQPVWPVSAKKAAKRVREVQGHSPPPAPQYQLLQLQPPPQPDHPPEGEPHNKLFVTLTDRTLSVPHIRAALTPLPGLIDTHLVPDAPPSSLLKGFGFLTFSSTAHATAARTWLKSRGCPVIKDARYPVEKKPPGEAESPPAKWPRLT